MHWKGGWKLLRQESEGTRGARYVIRGGDIFYAFWRIGMSTLNSELSFNPPIALARVFPDCKY